MAAELIYRTTSAAALEWRLDYSRRWNEAKKRWDAFELDVEAAIGIPEGEQHRSLYMLDGKVVGVVRTTDEWASRRDYPTLFPGWKEHQRWPILVPKLNTKAGKDWQAQLDALPVLSLRSEGQAIGIPDYVLTDGHMYSGGYDYDYDYDGDTCVAIYQSWGSGQCEAQVRIHQDRHPEVEWIEVPRSEWYARLEAKERETGAAS